MNKQELSNEIRKLKIRLNKCNGENEKLLKEIKDLKDEKEKSNKIIFELKKVIDTSKNVAKKDEGNNNINEINYLKEVIKEKDSEIKLLKLQLKNNTKETLVDLNKILVINFTSPDGLNCGLKCLETDIFAEVEEKLYQQYDIYRNTNNNFILKGNTILRFKTIKENNIKDNDKIMLIQTE